jgi:hypothetical protein
MSRRCKVGQRARFIAGLNKGHVVLVVRPQFEPTFEGSTWPMAIFPWVVTSLGGGLRSICIDTGIENPSTRSLIACDLDLEPLKDDDDGLAQSTERGTPLTEFRPN